MEDVSRHVKRCDDVLLEELKELSCEGNAVGFPAGITATVTQTKEENGIISTPLDLTHINVSSQLFDQRLGKLSRRVGS